jgi:hypothetical protein
MKMLCHLPHIFFTGIAGVDSRRSKGDWNSSQVQNIGSLLTDSASSGTGTVQNSIVMNIFCKYYESSLVTLASSVCCFEAGYRARHCLYNDQCILAKLTHH